MSKYIKEIPYKNHTICVGYSQINESPREWDNLGTMVCFHRRYDLGDKTEYRQNDYSSFEELEKDIIKKENVGVILPLYLYDHSGITMNTTGFTCKWDSGQIGFIFISKEKILNEFGGKRVSKKLKDKMERYLIGEVETYDKYLKGEVYEYDIKNMDDVIIVSCSGYYIEEDMINECKSIIDSL